MLMITGTIYNTIRLQTLNNKWMQKKESGNVLSRKEVNERANWSSDDWLKYNYKQQLEQDRQTSARNEIADKVMSGGTLTPDEERYLEQKDPQLLKSYREAKAQKKAYKERLKKCRTKDEVEQVKSQFLSSYLSSFKKIENNHYIPESQKLATAQRYLGITRNIEDAHEEFKCSGAYKKLPTMEQIVSDNVSKDREEQEAIIEKISENNDLEKVDKKTDESDNSSDFVDTDDATVNDSTDINNNTFLNDSTQTDNNLKSYNSEDNINEMYIDTGEKRRKIDLRL